MVYGDKVKPYDRTPSVIGEVCDTIAGNVTLRIGRQNEDGSGRWHQTEYVVLSPDEARAFLGELEAFVK